MAIRSATEGSSVRKSNNVKPAESKSTTADKPAATLTAPARADASAATVKDARTVAANNTTVQALKDKLNAGVPAAGQSTTQAQSGVTTGAAAAPANDDLNPSYPPELSSVVDVQSVLNSTPGTSQDKLNALADTLHDKMYTWNDSTKSWDRKTPAPFNDLQACSALYVASADLAKTDVLKSKPAGQTDAQYLKSDAGSLAWKDQFMSMLNKTLSFDRVDKNGRKMEFGDMGWDHDYQDGTAGQSSHFQAGLGMTYENMRKFGCPPVDANLAKIPAYELALLHETSIAAQVNDWAKKQNPRPDQATIDKLIPDLLTYLPGQMQHFHGTRRNPPQ